MNPFGITGAATQALNWLDTLDRASPEVLVLDAPAPWQLLVAPERAVAEPHWNDTDRELVRGLLIHVAGGA